MMIYYLVNALKLMFCLFFLWNAGNESQLGHFTRQRAQAGHEQ